MLGRSALFLIVAIATLTLGGGIAAHDGHDSCTLATPTAASPTPPQSTRIAIGDDEALFWPGGPQAVLLVHGAIYDAESWRPQAEILAGEGFTVLSLEQIGSDDVLAGIAYLQETCGVEGITIVGASAGVSGSVSAASQTEAGIDGLIVLAGSGDFSSLGDYPKLFAASDGESGSLEAQAANAPGDDNRVLVVPGSAHAQAIFLGEGADQLMDGILAFLQDLD